MLTERFSEILTGVSIFGILLSIPVFVISIIILIVAGKLAGPPAFLLTSSVLVFFISVVLFIWSDRQHEAAIKRRMGNPYDRRDPGEYNGK